MNKVIYILLATLAAGIAQADEARMKAMREAFDRMDRDDFYDGIEMAGDCTQRRDFPCAERQLARIRDLADGEAAERLYSLAAGNLQAEIQRVAEEQRLRREAEERRQREEASRIAAEEAAERRRRIAEEEESARVIGAAILSVGESVGKAYADIAAGNARTQAMMNEYHESVARENRRAAEARAEQSRRDREERNAQENYERKRAAASAQLAAALRESREQSQREAGINAYQQAQATTAAARTSSSTLSGSATSPGSGTANTARTSAAPFAAGAMQDTAPATSDGVAASPAAAKPVTDGNRYTASPEGVVICELGTGGRFTCHTTLGTLIDGGPNQPAGWRTPEEAAGYVGGCRSPRRITWRAGYEVFGCGTGITGMSNYIDVAAKLGVTVPGRNTYWCKPLEIGCNRTSRPGQ